MAPPDPDRGLKFNALGDRMPVKKVAHIMRGMIKFYEKASTSLAATQSSSCAMRHKERHCGYR